MFYKKLDSAIGVLNSINNALVVVSLAGMFIILMLQIISRFMFYFTMAWAQDVIIFLMMTVVFFGAGSATAVDKHIRLEFFIHFFKPAAQRIFLIIADIISLIFLGLICYQAWILGAQGIKSLVGASPITFGVYYYVVGFGCFVMLLNFVDLIIKRIKYIPITGKASDDEGELLQGGDK